MGGKGSKQSSTNDPEINDGASLLEVLQDLPGHTDYPLSVMRSERQKQRLKTLKQLTPNERGNFLKDENQENIQQLGGRKKTQNKKRNISRNKKRNKKRKTKRRKTKLRKKYKIY